MSVNILFREECDKYSQRVKTVEDALFRANDSYEDMRQENIDLIKEQKRYEQHIEHLEEEMGNWEEEREQHKKDLRYFHKLSIYTLR